MYCNNMDSYNETISLNDIPSQLLFLIHEYIGFDELHKELFTDDEIINNDMIVLNRRENNTKFCKTIMEVFGVNFYTDVFTGELNREEIEDLFNVLAEDDYYYNLMEDDGLSEEEQLQQSRNSRIFITPAYYDIPVFMNMFKEYDNILDGWMYKKKMSNRWMTISEGGRYCGYTGSSTINALDLRTSLPDS